MPHQCNYMCCQQVYRQKDSLEAMQIHNMGYVIALCLQTRPNVMSEKIPERLTRPLIDRRSGLRLPETQYVLENMSALGAAAYGEGYMFASACTNTTISIYGHQSAVELETVRQSTSGGNLVQLEKSRSSWRNLGPVYNDT